MAEGSKDSALEPSTEDPLPETVVEGQPAKAPLPETLVEGLAEDAPLPKTVVEDGKPYETVAPPNGEAKSGDRRRIGGYELRSELARGGMGAVYRAWHPELSREVAVKLLLSGDEATPDQVERFRREARAAARLQHANIVAIHDVGEEDGIPYLVMDLVEGQSLKQRLADPEPLSQREAAVIARELASALAYAHANAVLHRDMKPANVLLDEGGVAQITDFGLAKDLRFDDGITRSGAVMGTPSYMPPELAEGDHERVDRRADVYSLGATLYEMLAGRPPFRGQSVVAVLKKVMTDEPTPPSRLRAGLDRDLETICLTCLEKEPEQRYPTAAALAADLERYLKHEPITARPPGLLGRARKWTRRNRTLSWGMGIGLAAALALGAVGLTTHVVRLNRQIVKTEAARQREAAAAADAQQQTRRAQEATRVAQAAVEAERTAKEAERKAKDRAESKAREARIAEAAARESARIAQEEKQRADAEATLARAAEAREREEAERARRALGNALERDGRLAAKQGAWERAATLFAAALEIEDLLPRRHGALDALGRTWSSTVRRHAGPVVCLAWSPNGHQLASGSQDRTVRLWTRGKAEPVLTLGPHRREVNRVGWIGDNQVGCTTLDSKIHRWNAYSGLRSGPARKGDMFTTGDYMGWAPDGTRVATAVGESKEYPAGCVALWDGRRSQLGTLRGHSAMVIAVTWSPDSQLFATGSRDRTVRLWTREGKPVATLEGHTGAVRHLAWSPDGTLLASGGDDHTVRLWSRKARAHVTTLEGHAGMVRDLAWAPDSRRLASAGNDRRICVWDARSKALLSTLEGHGGYVHAVAWSPDSERLASGSEDGTVRIWSRSAGERPHRVLRAHPEPIRRMKWSPDGARLASSARTVRLWSATGQHLRTLQHTYPTAGIAWSPDGDQLATGMSSVVRRWDIGSGKPLQAPPEDVRGTIDDIAWSSDGSWIVYVANEQLHLLNPQNRSVVPLYNPQHRMQAVAFAPDGRTFVSADNTLCLWDSATRKPRSDQLRGHKTWIEAVVFSPDGKRLASASHDKTVRVWDVASKTLLRTLAHPDKVDDVAWSPDGKQLASGCWDGRLRLWNTATGELDLELPDHPKGIVALAWSSKGQLATGRRDGTIRLWDLGMFLSPAEEVVRLVRERTGLLVVDLDVVPAARAGKK